MSPQKTNILIPTLTVFFSIAAFLGVLYLSLELRTTKTAGTINNNLNRTACTLEVQQCPDGSFVGREGADCAFAECPDVDFDAGNTNNSGSTDDQQDVTPRQVIDLTEHFSWDGYAGISASVMGDMALIGSHGGRLYQYSSDMVREVTEHIQVKDPEGKTLQPGLVSLADNEQYWMILTKTSETGNHLYRYDGRVWTDLTGAYNAMREPSTFPFGAKLMWIQDRWYIFGLDGKIITYDGSTFADITAKFPTQINRFFLAGAADGNAVIFAASVSTANNSYATVTYRYDGNAAIETGRFDVATAQRMAGWNGAYWLVADESGSSYLRYDGEQVIQTSVPAQPGFFPLWLGSYWIVGDQLYDGENLRPAPWAGLRRAYTVDLGDTYGIITSYNDRVIRFNLPIN